MIRGARAFATIGLLSAFLPPLYSAELRPLTKGLGQIGRDVGERDLEQLHHHPPLQRPSAVARCVSASCGQFSTTNSVGGFPFAAFADRVITNRFPSGKTSYPP